MNSYTELYKKDSNGRIRILKMWTEKENLVQETGLLNGKLVLSKSLCKGKNKGKKNETTSSEQAIKELQSKVKKKLREGYFDSKEKAMSFKVEKPMLAKSFDKHSSKIDWSSGVWLQPKLDGQRAKGLPGKTYKLFSRNNKEIETMFHITSMLQGCNLILDGELYCHGISFQDNMKLIKKYRPGETEEVCWNVYDIQSDLPYSDRQHLLLTW